jgi:DNA topoisomerase-1
MPGEMDIFNDSDDDKPLARRALVKEMEARAVLKPTDDDSDDDKPLVDRKPLKTYVRKDSLKKNVAMTDIGSMKRAAQVQPIAPPEKRFKVSLSSALKSEAKKEQFSDDDDDDEDDLPLAQRKPSISSIKKTMATQQKAKASSSSRAHDVDMVNKFPVKATTAATGNIKRAAQAQPSVAPEKKIKVSLSLATKSQAKKEVLDDDDDDEDDVPLAQRKPAISSINKAMAVQQKTKVQSSSGSTANAAKKFLEKAKTLKAQKLLKKKKMVKVTTMKTKTEPGSGESQKWQTLEHNGVIFPPPYESHGVKMLYDGKPVDLTIEQEEVSFLQILPMSCIDCDGTVQ